MSAGNLQELADRVVAPLRTTAGSVLIEIVPPMVALLARGKPVPMPELVEVTGKPVKAVRAALDQCSDIEWDEQERIVGAGLSLRPTAHRVELDGRALHTWCALDALIFVAHLDVSARVISRCRATGNPVTIACTPAGIETVDPASAALTVVEPEGHANLRGVVCENSHFFASLEAAERWLDQRPAATALPVDDGFRLGQLVTEAFLRIT